MVRFGFHSVHFSPMFGGRAPLVDVIAATGGAGFDAIGLDLPSVEASGASTDVGHLLADRGLACTDVLVLVAGADPDLGGTARRLGELAERVGAPTCIAAVATPLGWPRLVTELGRAADVLADHGCRLAVEFTPYSPLATLGHARHLQAAVGPDRCALVLDSLHLARAATDPSELTSLRAADVAVVQWSDAPAARPIDLAAESRHGRLLPGHGALPLVDLAAAVRATGWDGVVTAEVLSGTLRTQDPATIAAAVHASLTAAASGWASA